ncbi:MAG: sugar-binding protein [Pricia sp.]|nr:sugar-binding protein [Pricia sp.]
MKTALGACILLLALSCSEIKKKEDHQIIEVDNASIPPTIDGIGSENNWNKASWHALDQNWLGDPYDYDDFNGRYKLLWDENALYILLEVKDDVLYDQNKNPVKLWWNDDGVKIYIDEDNSGGLHQYNHNAFAYHIALDGNVVDMDSNKQPELFNDHILSKRTSDSGVTIWEFMVKVFNKNYSREAQNTQVRLSAEKKIGFALAYCDNDGSTERENLIGSVFVPGEDKNQGWINADIFGTLILKE